MQFKIIFRVNILDNDSWQFITDSYNGIQAWLPCRIQNFRSIQFQCPNKLQSYIPFVFMFLCFIPAWNSIHQISFFVNVHYHEKHTPSVIIKIKSKWMNGALFIKVKQTIKQLILMNWHFSTIFDNEEL